MSPRIAKELSVIDIKAFWAFVAKNKTENHLHSIAKMKFRKITNSAHRYLTAQNILEYDFKAIDLNKVWVSGITYIETDEGCLYPTMAIDLFAPQ